MSSDAVLVIAFNRPDHLTKLIETLRLAQPERVYVAIDGPRVGREDEALRVAHCRDLVACIDWTEQVFTNFQQVNLGCGRGVSSAISWFFDNEARGIILEDDIIPDPSFFSFCSEMLDRYENDPRVFAVTGCNVVPPSGITRPQEPYRFSQITHVWGWATWKRTWDKHVLYDTGWYRKLPPWKLFAKSNYSLANSMFWGANFELTARGDVDTWDYQLNLASMIAGQLTVIPNNNLIENIGFGEFATHTHEGTPKIEPRGSISLPVGWVPVVLDRKADAWTMKHHNGASVLTTVDRFRKYFLEQRAAKKQMKN